MAKRVNVPISTARRQLFQLADLVRKSDGDAIVVLEQRGESERVALVREARMAYLEERVMQLERQRAEPFSLAGSLSSAVADAALEEELHKLRLEWGASPAPTNDPAPRRGTRRPTRG